MNHQPQPPPAGPTMPQDPTGWLRERLTADRRLWDRLEVTGADRVDAEAAVERLLTEDSVADRERVVDAAIRLPGLLGRFTAQPPFFGEGGPRTPAPEPGEQFGVTALLALAAAVPELRAYHRSRGVSEAVSDATLSDLGQQVRVHRATFGEFGLHTQDWLTCAWSGALYALGRLQFNLQWSDGLVPGPPRWLLSTHIPARGPLDPDQVDDSFAAAQTFFARHFGDYPVREFYCASWLLDPRLARLDPASNMARFQARWQLTDEGDPANGDAFFFLWHRRGAVDPAELPADSSLRRLVRSEIMAGRSWRLHRGLIDFSG